MTSSTIEARCLRANIDFIFTSDSSESGLTFTFEGIQLI